MIQTALKAHARDNRCWIDLTTWNTLRTTNKLTLVWLPEHCGKIGNEEHMNSQDKTHQGTLVVVNQ